MSRVRRIDEEWPELFIGLSDEQRSVVVEAWAAQWHAGWEPNREDAANSTALVRCDITSEQYRERVYAVARQRAAARRRRGESFPQTMDRRRPVEPLRGQRSRLGPDAVFGPIPAPTRPGRVSEAGRRMLRDSNDERNGAVNDEQRVGECTERKAGYAALTDDFDLPGFDTVGSDASSWLQWAWLAVGDPSGLDDGDPLAMVRERLVLAALHTVALRIEAIVTGNDEGAIDECSAERFNKGISVAAILTSYGLEVGGGAALFDGDPDSPDDVAVRAFIELVAHREARVHRALIAADGVSMPFARLLASLFPERLEGSATDGGEPVGPPSARREPVDLTDDDAFRILNDVTTDKARAFDWWVAGG